MMLLLLRIRNSVDLWKKLWRETSRPSLLSLLLRSAMSIYILEPWRCTKLAVLRRSSAVPQSLVYVLVRIWSFNLLLCWIWPVRKSSFMGITPQFVLCATKMGDIRTLSPLRLANSRQLHEYSNGAVVSWINFMINRWLWHSVMARRVDISSLKVRSHYHS
jgi:hypothetical protein